MMHGYDGCMPMKNAIPFANHKTNATSLIPLSNPLRPLMDPCGDSTLKNDIAVCARGQIRFVFEMVGKVQRCAFVNCKIFHSSNTMTAFTVSPSFMLSKHSPHCSSLNVLFVIPLTLTLPPSR